MNLEEFLLYLILVSSYVFFTGFFAHTKGRSFIVWSVAAMVLPVISQIVLFIIPGKVSKDMEGTGMSFDEEKHMEQIIQIALKNSHEFKQELKKNSPEKK